MYKLFFGDITFTPEVAFSPQNLANSVDLLTSSYISKKYCAQLGMLRCLRFSEIAKDILTLIDQEQISKSTSELLFKKLGEVKNP